MPKKKKSITELILEAHERSIELAIDTSIRTGVPLVVAKEGKIYEIPPKFKYVRVPIEETARKPNKRTSATPKPKKRSK